MRFLLIALSSLALIGYSSPKTAAADKPNIVYILADDLGYGDLGCYNKDSKIPTPNLDRLAKEGMRFTDAHAPSSVCSPSRYALLTGRYAWRSRLQRGVLLPYDPPLIDAGRLTVPALLKQQGYTTACVGKWHLGWDWPKPGPDGKRDFTQAVRNGPTTRGFDSYFGTDVPNFPPYCFVENDHTFGLPTIPITVGRDGFNRAGVMLPGWKLVDILPELEKRGVRTVEEAAKSGKPFFLYMPLTSPHYPIVPTPEFKGRSGAGDYGDFVMQTDAVVGRILDALERTGTAKNTLVIFTSDNGPEVTGEVNPGVYDRLKQYDHASMGPLRGAKRDAWEGGHCVPFLARWPGKINPGSVSPALICHLDLMATVAAILGTNLPADAGVDSVNILPVLLGAMPLLPLRETVVHHTGGGKFAIRKGPWVLILAPSGDDNGRAGEPAWFREQRGYRPHNQPGELFNLAENRKESDNLYAAHPEKVKELTAILADYLSNGRSTPGPAQANDVAIKWQN
ncbi:MAG TPA: arylsulfatase [Gemmataceae bacterium]|jgi:arylsulfatase A-like enzyme|nr:arylsulfatase [Gemmataceae bacterium]